MLISFRIPSRTNNNPNGSELAVIMWHNTFVSFSVMEITFTNATMSWILLG